MPLSDEDDYLLTTPGVSPAFPEEAVRDPQSICRVLQNFGRDQPNDRDVAYALEFFSASDLQIVFTLTFMQKFLAALKYDWDGHAVTRLPKYYPGLNLTELEPLLWEDDTMDTLIMYHGEDKSFWAYRYDRAIDPEFQLVQLGYKWTDVTENYPALHFSMAETETRKRRRKEEKMAPKKRRKGDRAQDISGYEN